MSWFTKVGLFLSVFCLSFAHAGRVYFSSGAQSGVESRLVDERGSMSSLEVHFSIPHMDVDHLRDGFDKVTAPNLVPLEIPGLPELFSTGSLVAVPPGFEPEVQWVSKEETTVNNVSVRPAQRKYRCDCDENAQFAFDSVAYKSNGVFPQNQVVMEEVGRVQGVRLIRVGFYPAQYNFAHKTLKVVHDAQIKVSFRQTTDSLTRLTLTKPVFNMLRAAAANGAALTQELVRVERDELMLIIAGDKLVDTMKPFVDWKKSKGMKVEMVNFTTAGGTKEKVKAYIKDYYTKATLKPSYLLFVGNKDSMPGFSESTGSGAAATDFTYAVINSTDKVPSLPYGRFLADNADELKIQIDRSVNYEMNPEKGADWYRAATTIASDEGADPSDKDYAEQIAETLKKNTYTEVDGFFQGEDNATFKNIAEALKKGRSWLAYFGHGSGTSWGSTNDTFDVKAVGKLENDNRLPIIIDVACQNASWVKLAKSFGKTWVTSQRNGANIGAVAFYGGSVNISWHPPAIMSVGIAKQHFEKPVYNMGGSVMAGQLYLIEQKGSNDDTMDNFKWYNLFGDPSLLIRTNTPTAYDLNVSGANGVVTVKATDSKGNAVANLLVSVGAPTSADMITAVTGADGVATLTVGLLKGDATVTASGYNLETQKRAVTL